MRTEDTQPERQNGPVLLKPGTVADRLEIGQRTLWRWVSTGLFPRPDLRFGRKIVRWKAATLLAWVEVNANANAKGGGK